MTPRSWLFAPADSPAKMEKACASGADAVIVDLEDSVAPARKADARAMAAAFTSGRVGREGPAIWVRINPTGTDMSALDLEAVVPARPAGIVLPKALDAAHVVRVGELVGELERREGLHPGAIELLPIATETPRAVFGLASYQARVPRLAALTWGAEDLSSAVGAVSPRDSEGRLTEPYRLARSLCLFAAAAAEVAAIETVFPAFREGDALVRYVAEGRRDGFTGMMAIHPAQVATINAGFTPSAAEVDEARRIVDLFAEPEGAGTLAMDGRMLDRPHLVAALRVLERAKQAG